MKRIQPVGSIVLPLFLALSAQATPAPIKPPQPPGPPAIIRIPFIGILIAPEPLEHPDYPNLPMPSIPDLAKETPLPQAQMVIAPLKPEDLPILQDLVQQADQPMTRPTTLPAPQEKQRPVLRQVMDLGKDAANPTFEALQAAFDGSKTPGESKPVESSKKAKFRIEPVGRPVTLPENDLEREIGISRKN